VVKAWLKDLVGKLTGHSDDHAALARLEERMDALVSDRLVCPACLGNLDRPAGGADLVSASRFSL